MQHTKILDREAIIQIAILIVSGAILLASFAGVRVAGFDPAWIAIVFCGLPILKEAAIGLITEFDIRADVLVSLALIAAVAIGEYFAAGEVALIMQIGGLLEELTVKRAQAGLERLVAMTPETARIVGPDGTETVIPAEEVKAGDTVRVIPGEKVPVDGEILDGITSIDQSVLTGEPVPVDRGPGDTVISGTVNRFGTFLMKATKVGDDRTIARMAALIKSADAGKAKIVRVADRWATWIVVMALTCAVIAYLASGEIIRAVTVLVVFCPCALVLATPTAVMAAIGNAARHGVLVKEGDALERLADVKQVAFDKTGTLTAGSPRVETVHSVNSEIRDTELYQLAAASESLSEHPLGKAIVNGWKNDHREAFPAVSDFRMIPAKGVEASVGGKSVRTGKIGFIADRGDPRASELESAAKRYLDLGDTVIYIAVNGVPSGFIALNDPVRSSVSRSVAELKALGVSPVLLTGDNAVAAKRIAEETGIPRFEANCLPETKLEFLREGERSGKPAAMIGDGVNDAPALKASRVGIAMGGVGSDIAIEAADIVLVKDSIDEVPHLFRLSRRTRRMIKWNITFAMGINLVATGLGMLGLMGPVVGALVHNGGSVFVILNSARLLRDRTREKSEPVNLVPRKA